MEQSSNYYGPHRTKPEYNRAFNSARIWAIENPKESPRAAARIYHVKEEALRKSIIRFRKPKERNAEGEYNSYGGNNKILNASQEEAIRQYCYEQWEMG